VQAAPSVSRAKGRPLLGPNLSQTYLKLEFGGNVMECQSSKLVLRQKVVTILGEFSRKLACIQSSDFSKPSFPFFFAGMSFTF